MKDSSASCRNIRTKRIQAGRSKIDGGTRNVFKIMFAKNSGGRRNSEKMPSSAKTCGGGGWQLVGRHPCRSPPPSVGLVRVVAGLLEGSMNDRHDNPKPFVNKGLQLPSWFDSSSIGIDNGTKREMKNFDTQEVASMAGFWAVSEGVFDARIFDAGVFDVGDFEGCDRFSHHGQKIKRLLKDKGISQDL
jgi:hypothetical protein